MAYGADPNDDVVSIVATQGSAAFSYEGGAPLREMNPAFAQGTASDEDLITNEQFEGELDESLKKPQKKRGFWAFVRRHKMLTAIIGLLIVGLVTWVLLDELDRRGVIDLPGGISRTSGGDSGDPVVAFAPNKDQCETSEDCPSSPSPCRARICAACQDLPPGTSGPCNAPGAPATKKICAFDDSSDGTACEFGDGGTGTCDDGVCSCTPIGSGTGPTPCSAAELAVCETSAIPFPNTTCVEPIECVLDETTNEPRCLHPWLPEGATCTTSRGTGTCDAEARCIQPPLTVFVTSGTTNGSFGGIAEGDAICNAEATAAGVTGSFIAWLSDSNVDAYTRLTGILGLADPLVPANAPYELVDGTLVSESADNLTEFSNPGKTAFLQNAIDLEADGTAAVSNSFVWTATDSDGTGFGTASCVDWTSALGSEVGIVGAITQFGDDWTNVGVAFPCDTEHLLYCFEIA